MVQKMGIQELIIWTLSMMNAARQNAFAGTIAHTLAMVDAMTACMLDTAMGIYQDAVTACTIDTLSPSMTYACPATTVPIADHDA